MRRGRTVHEWCVILRCFRAFSRHFKAISGCETWGAHAWAGRGQKYAAQRGYTRKAIQLDYRVRVYGVQLIQIGPPRATLSIFRMASTVHRPWSMDGFKMTPKQRV